MICVIMLYVAAHKLDISAFNIEKRRENRPVSCLVPMYSGLVIGYSVV